MADRDNFTCCTPESNQEDVAAERGLLAWFLGKYGKGESNPKRWAYPNKSVTMLMKFIEILMKTQQQLVNEGLGDSR